jgi:hypothetical protein
MTAMRIMKWTARRKPPAWSESPKEETWVSSVAEVTGVFLRATRVDTPPKTMSSGNTQAVESLKWAEA